MSTAVPAKKKPARAGKKKPLPKKNFGAWARRYAGIVSIGQRDLSMREGFGD